MKQSRNFNRVAFLLLALLPLAGNTWANIGIAREIDILDVAKPALKRFSDENGLPSNSVMTLDRDREGRFWIGTQDGAAYFNGNRWIVVNMPDRNRSNYVYDILPASDGSMWFATDGGGVHVLKNGEWTTYDASHGLPGNSGRALAESANAEGRPVVWAGTRDGLAKFDNGSWSKIDLGPETSRNRIRSLLVTRNSDTGQTVWAATYGGVVLIRNGESKLIDTAAGLPHNTVYCLYEGTDDAGRSVVFAGTESGLAVIADEKASAVTLPPETPKKGVRAVLETVDNNGNQIFWVGLDGGGLVSRARGKWRIYDNKTELPSDNVMALADAGIGDGSIWMSLLGTGLTRLELGNWATIGESQGLPNKIVFAITEHDNSHWFGTFGGGVARFGGDWKTWNARSGLADDFVYSLYRAAEPSGGERLWAGMEKGIREFDSTMWSSPKTAHPTLQTETWDFLLSAGPTGQETKWIATSRGLVQIDGDQVKVHDTGSGLPDNRIRAVHAALDAKGQRTIWAGTYGGGIARLQGENWQIFDTNAGLPSERVLAITEFTIGGRNNLFVGTSGGIAVLDPDDPASPPQVINAENTPGMLNNYVLDLVKDDRGRLYALTNKGVTRFTPVERPDQAFEVYTFTTEDGLPSNECVSGSGYFDRQGRLFVGTVNGVGVLDTSRETLSAAPKLLIENISVNGKSGLLADGTELSHRENHLRFDYALLGRFRESATRYRSQLEGLDEAATDWTSDAYRDLSFVPPGEYRMIVWARDHAGNITQAATPAFVIRPAWWQTWWAMLLYLLGIVAVVSLIAYLVYRNRLNRLLEIERVRTRIATDLHDDIGASLSKIAILSEVVTQKLRRDGTAEIKPLAAIADTSRDLTNSMSDIVWAINPKRDHLIDLVQRMRRFATDVLSGQDIDFDFSAPENADGIRLNLETRRQVHLIFKEAVNNCVRHSDCTKVNINIAVDPQAIDVKVTDNGGGFDADVASEGNGLANMRARADAIGGTLKISSSDKGTSVNLSVPNRSRSGMLKRFLPV